MYINLLIPFQDQETDRPAVSQPKTPDRTVQETREWIATKIFTAGPESVLGRHFTYVLIEREQREDEAQPPPADKQVIGYVGINQVYPSPEIGFQFILIIGARGMR